MLAPWERKRKEELKRKAAEKKDELKRSGSDAAILQNISEDAPNTELGKSQHETCLHLVRSLARDPRKSCVLVFVAGQRRSPRGKLYNLDQKSTKSELSGHMSWPFFDFGRSVAR